MRDLEVRGAGSLLGAEQHGHMDMIGYELYCRLLDEEVRLLKEGKDEVLDTDVIIGCNAVDLGSIPGLEGFPGEGNGNPLQYSCLENPMDRGQECPALGQDSLRSSLLSSSVYCQILSPKYILCVREAGGK